MATKLSEKMRTLLTALAEAGDTGMPCWDKRFHLGTARALANRKLVQKEHANALVTRWRITEEGRKAISPTLAETAHIELRSGLDDQRP